MQDIIPADPVDSLNLDQVGGLDDGIVFRFRQPAVLSALQALVNAQAAALPDHHFRQLHVILRNDPHCMRNRFRVLADMLRYHSVIIPALQRVCREYIPFPDDIDRRKESIKCINLVNFFINIFSKMKEKFQLSKYQSKLYEQLIQLNIWESTS